MANGSYEDITDRAINSLDTVLTKGKEGQGDDDQVPLETALSDAPVVEYDSGRSKTRVLFITADTTFLNPTKDTLESFYDFSKQFDEMHIVVLRVGIKPRASVMRLRENIWVYTAYASSWWLTPQAVMDQVVKKELVFAGGFRPDVVVALEPFEAGLAAEWIGKKYGRPVQIHVRENYLQSKEGYSWWQRLLAGYVMHRATHVAVTTDAIAQSLIDRYHVPSEIQKLPRLYDFDEVKNAKVFVDLHERYHQYDTIILFVGSLSHQSSLLKAIDFLKYKLANPRVGLVVLGDGPALGEIKKKVRTLGLVTQVVFETDTLLTISYLKSADLLVVTDETKEGEDVVLRGVVVGVPMLMSETESRLDMFTDGEDAYLCPADDTKCFIKKMNTFMSDKSAVREQFTQALETVVTKHLQEDPLTFRRTYRDVIETVFDDQENDEITGTKE